MSRRLVLCTAVVVLGLVATALLLPATASAALKTYSCASGFVSVGGNGPYVLGLGQSVNTVVKNNNVLGLGITVSESYFGTSQAGVVAPYSSHTFSNPAVFGAEPIGYRFSLSTPANSIVASFTFRSYFCGRETGQATSGLNNKCMNLKGNKTADGTKVTVDTCANVARQQWTWGYRHRHQRLRPDDPDPRQVPGRRRERYRGRVARSTLDVQRHERPEVGEPAGRNAEERRQREMPDRPQRRTGWHAAGAVELQQAAPAAVESPRDHNVPAVALDARTRTARPLQTERRAAAYTPPTCERLR
jgi:hypothetical protein